MQRFCRAGTFTLLTLTLSSAPAASAGDWRRLVPAATPTALALERDGYLLYAVALLVKIAFFALLLTGGRAGKLQDSVHCRIRISSLAALATLALYYLLYQVIQLPLGWISYLIYHRYGIAVQSPAHWWTDAGKGLLLGLLIYVPVMALILSAIRRWPERWWLAATALIAALAATLVYVAPLVIDPLFHRFTPMAPSALRSDLLNLANRAGLEVHGVFVGQFSATTTEGNAYVTGLGGSHRVVIWDTLIKLYTPDELKAIVAHELGHYALHHILIGMSLSILGSLFLFRGLSWMLHRGVARGWLRSPTEPAAIIPLVAAIFVVNLTGMPFTNAVSRIMEAQADDFSLRLTRHPDWFIAAMQHLCRQNYGDPWPPPVARLLFSNHPTIAERIHTAWLFAQQNGLNADPLKASSTPSPIRDNRRRGSIDP